MRDLADTFAVAVEDGVDDDPEHRPRRERSWTLASACADRVSIRALAAAAGLSCSRVHQIVAARRLDELERGRWVRCGRRAGRTPKIPVATMMRNWTAGTPGRRSSATKVTVRIASWPGLP